MSTASLLDHILGECDIEDHALSGHHPIRSLALARLRGAFLNNNLIKTFVKIDIKIPYLSCFESFGYMAQFTVQKCIVSNAAQKCAYFLP